MDVICNNSPYAFIRNLQLLGYLCHFHRPSKEDYETFHEESESTSLSRPRDDYLVNPAIGTRDTRSPTMKIRLIFKKVCSVEMLFSRRKTE